MNLIETERLFLRPLIESDANQLYADWFNNPKMNQYLETTHSVQTVEGLLRNNVVSNGLRSGRFLLGILKHGLL